MPAFDPIDLSSFVNEKYKKEIKAVKKYLSEAFPDSKIGFAYSVDNQAIAFKVVDDNGYNIVMIKSMFLEDLDAPLDTRIGSSGIKEFIAMNREATLVVSRAGELQLRIDF